MARIRDIDATRTTPMLVVSRQNFDSDRVPVEFGRTWLRGDRVTLVTRLGPRRR